MTTCHLLLVRHGQSTWNAAGRWQGRADVPLSDLGEQQARDAAAHLRDAGLTAAAASDLERARRTAEILAEALSLGAVELDPDLRERDVGEFSGHTITEILERWPDLFDEAGRLVGTPPGAEPLERVPERVVPALARIAARHPGERVLVVTHAGVIRSLDRHTGAAPPPTTPNLGGRWWHAGPDGALEPGDPLVPVEPEIVTAPATE